MLSFPKIALPRWTIIVVLDSKSTWTFGTLAVRCWSHHYLYSFHLPSLCWYLRLSGQKNWKPTYNFFFSGGVWHPHPTSSLSWRGEGTIKLQWAQTAKNLFFMVFPFRMHFSSAFLSSHLRASKGSRHLGFGRYQFKLPLFFIIIFVSTHQECSIYCQYWYGHTNPCRSGTMHQPALSS